MAAEIIFLPMLGMMVLTAVVWFYMYALRIPAMRKARVSVQTYTTPDKVVNLLPESVAYPANNLKNLFELPVLFYVLCLYLHASGNVDSFNIIGAWLFFAFRVAHSIVHCTRNIVMVRFYLYAGSAMILWLLLGRAVFDAMG